MDFGVSNVKVYDLDESIKASGYPMSTDAEEVDYSEERAEKLAKAKPGTGHNCYLKGITVNANVTAPQYWWLQFGRYHFADIVSSQSKMHRVTNMDIAGQCNKYVDSGVIGILKDLIKEHELLHRKDYQTTNQYHEDEKILFQRIISNCPMGLMLTARITTNYLQLKTIYQQRENHKLEEWHKFCDWIESLPYSELITE